MTDDDDDPTNDDDNDDVEICVHFSHAGSSDSTYYTYSAIFAKVEKKQIFFFFAFRRRYLLPYRRRVYSHLAQASSPLFLARKSGIKKCLLSSALKKLEKSAQKNDLY